MPKMSETRPSQSIKALICGQSGTGKTGALASLAEAGYKLRVLDFDNGLAPLFEYASPAARQRIVYETLKDPKAMVANVMKVIDPKAAMRAVSLLDRWKDSETGEDLGVPAKWDSDTIVVLDSLSLFGNACLDWVLKKNAINIPRIQDWGEAQKIVSGAIELLTAPSFNPHVLVLTHIDYDKTDEGVIFRGAPSSLGQALKEQIPKHFNIMLGVNRKIYTKTALFVDFKFPKAGAKSEYPLDTGLREIFKFLRGTEPGASSTATGVKS